MILAVHTHYSWFHSILFCNSMFDLDRSDLGLVVRSFDTHSLYDSMYCAMLRLNKWWWFLSDVEHHVRDNKCLMNLLNCKIHFCK